VLDGEGVLRLGEEEHVLRPATTSPFRPASGAPGDQPPRPPRFLAFSTLLEPEVAVYPDSKKVGLLAESWDGLGAQQADRDYY